MIKPTSKEALRRECLMLSRLNIERAEKMYDFLVRDIGDSIPDVEPETKPFIKNFGDQANDIFSWLRENQDMLGEGVNFIKRIISGRKGANAAPLPPINE